MATYEVDIYFENGNMFEGHVEAKSNRHAALIMKDELMPGTELFVKGPRSEAFYLVEESATDMWRNVLRRHRP